MTDTCVSVVREHFPKASKEQAQGLLWGVTSYPFVDVERIKEQLAESAKKAGGSIINAFQIADQELDEAMKGVGDTGLTERIAD